MGAADITYNYGHIGAVSVGFAGNSAQLLDHHDQIVSLINRLEPFTGEGANALRDGATLMLKGLAELGDAVGLHSKALDYAVDSAQATDLMSAHSFNGIFG
ncbi:MULTISPECIES: WXG100 family type VII secretion target [Mycobacterium]|uniref:Uncharacterized protein n=1 Tax=Mycobacterium talmoniae TaxID=1858794 RepID=A0A1S1NF65_9MYCO|nr:MULTISPECIES: hypothetical protein [Mycobacterium]OHU97489.1 hypothetical protein BKN37_21730 [Mycobacterium talmoniae]PQM49593.1 hypothetical protein C1Y40_00180 [Mycobacterium talmoniae]TDH46235.1 hypothetical protein E2F47_27325 [Mycobacterium eburneum]